MWPRNLRLLLVTHGNESLCGLSMGANFDLPTFISAITSFVSIVDSAVAKQTYLILSYLDKIAKKAQRVLGIQDKVLRFCREVQVVTKLTYFPVN